MSHRPAGWRGLSGPIEEGPLSIQGGVGAYFCSHLLLLLSALAPVQSRPVFALLICNFITRSLSALWQPLSRVPVLKTKLKLNLCCSQQKVSMVLLAPPQLWCEISFQDFFLISECSFHTCTTYVLPLYFPLVFQCHVSDSLSLLLRLFVIRQILFLFFLFISATTKVSPFP